MNEKLPSSLPREELIIILEYMFEYAYDNKHLSSQQKIIQFAKSRYGVTIRRDRINTVLMHLYEMAEANPSRFPFKLNKVSLHSIDKYYITDHNYSDSEVIDIVTALKNDYSKSTRKITSLVNKTLRLVGGEEKRKILEKKINKIENRAGHISNEYQEVLDKLQRAATDKLFVKTRLKNPYNFEISNDHEEISQEIVKGNILMGYVHSLLQFPDETLVVFYLTTQKACLVAPIASVELVEDPINMEDWSSGIKFEINEKCKTVDKWVAKHYRGTTGNVYDLVLGIRPEQFEIIKAKYETYFDIELHYVTGGKGKKMEIIENEKKVYVPIDDKMEKLYYVHLQSNLSSFNNWYLNDKDILENVIIIYPKKVNNDILTSVIRLLTNRLNNYGVEQYDFTSK